MNKLINLLITTTLVVAIVSGYVFLAHDGITNEVKYNFNGQVIEATAQPLIDKIDGLVRGDRLTIYLSTPGGEVLSGYRIIDAMNRSKGKIHIHVSSHAMSMGADMLCQADSVSFSDFAIIMWHPLQENGVNMLRSDTNTKPQTAFLDGIDILMKKCKKFLTKEDYKTLATGGEVWVIGKTLKERLK